MISAFLLSLCLQAPGESPRDEIARLQRELEQARAEVQALRSELAREQELRIAREREFWNHTQALARLNLPELPAEVQFAVERPEGVPSDEPQVPPAAPLDLQRGRELLAALRALLVADGVRGIDLLEAGVPGRGWTGPVVFRILDPRGRLTGSLYAERLRLEASRAGRTVTLVLEEGYEARGGVDAPFDGTAVPELPDSVRARGVRRIVLPDVDPSAWIEALPELFPEEQYDVPQDDGRWDAVAVQLAINAFLREDAAGGWYRLRRIGGIRDGVLCEVHLEFFDREERLERRLFADRMRLLPQGQGMQILLEDGVQMRGERKTPFLQGRYRIYLPRARAEEWTRAGLPGLTEVPPGALRRRAGARTASGG